MSREMIKSLIDMDLAVVKQGRESNLEENVKIKIVVPLLEALGWTNADMDFESDVNRRKVDVLLKIDGRAVVIIEIKSLEQSLEEHRKQVFNYAKDKKIKNFVLTNGLVFELYKVTKWSQLDDPNTEPLVTIKREELIDRYGELSYYLCKTELALLLPTLKMRVDNNYILLRRILRDLKIKLSIDLKKKIVSLYNNDPTYRKKLDEWMEKIDWSVDWTWDKSLIKKGRIQNKFLQRKVENLLLSKGIYSKWKHCGRHQAFDDDCDACKKVAIPSINKTWILHYNKDESFKATVDNELRNNGICVDNFDRFALEGAYTFINRILFLRINEENTGKSYLGKEFVLQLKKLSSPKAIYHLIQSCFEEIAVIFDKIYIAPLFDDTYINEITLNKEIVLQIIEELQSFDFNSMDIDLIGSLYEENLDRDIRNVIGQFYTPREIIRYIISKLPLKEFVLDLEAGKSVLAMDPACGSGGFLTVMYDYLKEELLARSWSREEIFPLLIDCLYGFDIDNFAVQLSILNLLLKEKITDKLLRLVNIYVMDSVRAPLTGGQKALSEFPEFRGRELISTEDNRQDKITLSNIRKKRFRFIVGNPPFFEIKKFDGFKKLYPMIKTDSKPNIASLFLLRYCQFLEPEGILSFVFPASILFSDAYKNVRKYLVNNYTILELVQLGRAFSNVGLEQIIIFVKNTKPTADHYVTFIHKVKDLNNDDYKTSKVLQKHFIHDKRNRFLVFYDDEVATILDKVHRISNNLIDYALSYKDGTKERLAIFRGMGWEKNLSKKREVGKVLPAVKGSGLMRFGIKEYQYLPNELINDPSAKLKVMIENPKIMVQRLVSSKTRVVATKGDDKLITISTVENIILRKNSPWSLDFVIGILNSNFISYYVIDHVFMHSKLSTSLDQEYIGYLPIPVVGEKEQQVIEKLVQRLEKLVKEAISQGKTVKEIENSSSYIEVFDRLNREVYRLFGLTVEEEKVIEKRLMDFYNNN